MKKYNVLFDVDAEDDLFDIYRYVTLNDSIERADKLFNSLKRVCYKLKLLPHRGDVPPELFEIGVVEFREIRFKPYRILYSIESTSVLVHCILDGRRDIQSILQERLLR
ncbi:MAG: type II toxin-antitoxin system RelE/ParE family toxin [Bacteroidota bacterium]|nr:type II toxin-antitoxin system RelE/ParE family toxin [Bacteroidota bacterium]